MVTQSNMERRMEKARKAAALVGELSVREIASHLGISLSYAYALIDDPTGEKDMARKNGYRRPCPECGTPMSGHDGPGSHKAPSLCAACSQAEQAAAATWTRETIIAAIRKWERMYGQPPAAFDWVPTGYKNPASRALAEERYRGQGWPPGETVRTRFGSWNAAIEAAGFTPRRVGQRGPNRVSGKAA